MDKLAATLGITSLSKRQASRMAADLDGQVTAFRTVPGHLTPSFGPLVPDMVSAMYLEDGQLGHEWKWLGPRINELVSRVALARTAADQRAGALAGDDRAVAPESLSRDAWRLVEGAASYVHACKDLVMLGDPIEEGPCFALIRASIELAAACHWILAPRQRDERVERYLRWKGQNLRDADRGWEALPAQGKPPSDAARKELVAIAEKRPGVKASAVAAAKVGSLDLVREVGKRVETVPPLLFTWQLASAHAHGRGWADIGWAVVPLDDGTPEPLELTGIASRTVAPAEAARLLVDKTVDLYALRAGLRSSR